MTDPGNVLPSSFRDPSGFVFRDAQGVLLRQVNPSYAEHYRQLMDSGLYADLVKDRLLVEHEELPADGSARRVIRPQEIGCISYPYEWPFSALKHAALLTLEIQRRSLGFGMTLKDASAFNVQFSQGRPIFIDTLSFEKYVDGRPWVAYAQFCKHFLAPLSLMAKVNVDLGRLLALYIDGVPLDLASRLLPWRTRFNFGLLGHVHAHAWMIQRHARTDGAAAGPSPTIPKGRLLSLVESLKATIRKLSWKVPETEWRDYYQANSYTTATEASKRDAVARFLRACSPRTVWDLGANTGAYSRLAAEAGAETVAWDIDAACTEINYLACRKEQNTRILALRQDLANPSPALGWAHRERDSLAGRGPVDAILALALIHHLAIANNVPLPMVAEYFSSLCRRLIIEFVPKPDPQVQRLLRSREDIFRDYTREKFEASFDAWFNVLEAHELEPGGRVVYLMHRRR